MLYNRAVSVCGQTGKRQQRRNDVTQKMKTDTFWHNCKNNKQKQKKRKRKNFELNKNGILKNACASTDNYNQIDLYNYNCNSLNKKDN